MTLKDEFPRLVDVQYAPGEEPRNSSRRNEEAESKQIQPMPTMWMCLVVEDKSDAVKNNIA